jgi:thiol:disulfide interchange protein DsbC
MRTTVSRVAGLIALSVSAIVSAASSNTDVEKIKAALATGFPEVKIEAVLPTPMKGIYEVDTETDIVYTNATGEHVIMGQLIDSKTKLNLTTLRWDERNTIDFSKLPLDLAIKNVKGDGSRVLAVFSDPHCPFCQKLEKELETVDNVTVYTFLFPIEALHQGATEDSRKLWCSADRPASWKNWMVKQQTPAMASGACSADSMIEKVLALGNEMRVQSTPTLFTADGRRLTGARTAAELEERFAAVKANSPAKTASVAQPQIRN